MHQIHYQHREEIEAKGSQSIRKGILNYECQHPVKHEISCMHMVFGSNDVPLSNLSTAALLTP
jgi:hypothetical protein